MVDIVVLPMLVTPYSSFSPFSNSFTGDSMRIPKRGCKNVPWYLSLSGGASEETTVAGSCQKHLLASSIVSGLGVCMWDGSPGGEGSGWL